MRVVRRRHVVQSKENAGDDLRNKEEQQPGAKDISPLGTTWNWLVERLMQQRVDARTLVEPLDEPDAEVGMGGCLRRSFIGHRFPPPQAITSLLGTNCRKY